MSMDTDSVRWADPAEQSRLHDVALANDLERRTKLTAALEETANYLIQLGRTKMGQTFVAALQSEVAAHTKSLLRVNPSNPHDVVRLQCMIGVYKHIIKMIPVAGDDDASG